MLSRNSLLSGRQLQVRPSMNKFGSSHPQLEVCCVASWLPSYLNRQVIIMMDFNGVPEEVSSRQCNSTSGAPTSCCHIMQVASDNTQSTASYWPHPLASYWPQPLITSLVGWYYQLVVPAWPILWCH